MNRFLGIMGDTSVVGTILDLLDRYDPTVGGSGTLTPHEVKVLFGKLGFLLRGSQASTIIRGVSSGTRP